MRLKRITIQGFKSFATRTSFELDHGILAVVGPNGSGKSNVADAVRWVLGEQSGRLLRARKSEDVIFSGSGKRAALGMAEVSLTLDNADGWLPIDFAEVEIGRRLYRDGASEYLLNGARARLRDIQDILARADVGQNSYAIMGQGLVDSVLTMTADERRNLLDEAADVRRLRVRVIDAGEKLGATRQNMSQVEILVREIEPRLAQLERQASRASDHARLSAELLAHLGRSYSLRWQTIVTEAATAKEGHAASTSEDAAAQDQIARLHGQAERLAPEISRRRASIAREQERRSGLDRRRAEHERQVAIAETRQAHTQERLEAVALEFAALEQELAELGEPPPPPAETPLVPDSPAPGVAESEADLRDAEAALESLLAEARAIDDALAGASERTAGARRRIELGQERLAAIQTERETLAARRARRLDDLRAYGLRIRELVEERRRLDVRRAADRRQAEENRARIGKLEEELRGYEALDAAQRRELDSSQGRLDALTSVLAQHDGVTAGTRAVLRAAGRLADGPAPTTLEGVHGVVANLLQVPAPLEHAINAALESRLHAIVVDNRDDAIEAIALLNQDLQGRAQFLPLDTVRHVHAVNLRSEGGVVGVASKLVRYDRRYESIVETLLGRVIVCEDVQTAQRVVLRGLGSVVTLDGTFIEQNGIVSGGATDIEDGVFARQREVAALPLDIAVLREKVAANARQVEQARAAIDQVRLRATEAEASLAASDRDLDDIGKDERDERAELRRIHQDIAGIDSAVAGLDREVAAVEADIAAAGTEADALSGLDEDAPARREALAARVEAARAARNGAIEALGEARAAESAGSRRGEADRELAARHAAALARIERQLEARRDETARLESDAGSIASSLSESRAALDALDRDRAEPDGDSDPERHELERLEQHERQVQEQLRSRQVEAIAAERRRIDAEAAVAAVERRREALLEEIDRDGFRIDANGAAVSVDGAPGSLTAAPVETDAEALSARISEIRTEIRRLGPVNADAPADYTEQRERHEFLTGQLNDLERTETELREIIENVEREIEMRFISTFDQVDRSFRDYFQAFFGGGEAKLVLTRPDQPATTGIEIEATPPGKRISSLAMLSGGERSLTAVSLLFALLAANPAPFCVLDEVDAALDEANVGRFVDALERHAGTTQFVVITHNRKTVEIAESIYGVSMGTDGVSSVLSLRLADVPVEA